MGSDRHMRAAVVFRGEFQSTLPGWGATVLQADTDYSNNISIHAPRMGSDWRATRHVAGR